MKTIRTMAVALLTATMPLAALAQDALSQAVDKFVKAKNADSYITTDNYKSEEDTTTGLTAYYRSYDFSINKTDNKFEQLRDAFKNTTCQYYDKYMKNAGQKDESGQRVGYGLNGASTQKFGLHKERNYIVYLVRDTDHTKWRSCYALVWYEDPKADYKYTGSIHVIYSPDPQRIPKKKPKYALIAPGQQPQIFEYDITTNGLDFSMEKLDESMRKLDESLGKLDGLENDSLSYYNRVDGNVTTADEFLKSFGTLRSMYLRAETNQYSTSWKTSIVNRIVTLCRNGKKLLKPSEREVVTDELGQMQKQSSDKYLKGMLGVALKAIN